MAKHIEWVTFSVEKACEGGMGQKAAMALLRDAGIPSRRGYSPYVGQTGVEVPKQYEAKANDILFGPITPITGRS